MVRGSASSGPWMAHGPDYGHGRPDGGAKHSPSPAASCGTHQPKPLLRAQTLGNYFASARASRLPA